MNRSTLFTGVVVLIIVLGGAFFVLQSKEDKKVEAPIVSEKGKSETSQKIEGYQGQVLAGTSSPLLDFTKADYDKALASGKVIFLYFYANWCPICRVEVPNELFPAFNELTTDRVIGFRVNYNDSDTDEDEKALAKQFGITYQHSKVILKDGKQVIKSLDQWSKTQYLKEISIVAQ